MSNFVTGSFPWTWKEHSSSESLRLMDILRPDSSLILFSQFLSWGLNSYAPLMCIFGLVAFLKTYYDKLQSWIDHYFTVTLHVKATDETFDMLMNWVSSREVDNAARSIIARVGGKSRGAVDKSDKKPISFSPWIGSFSFPFKCKTFLFEMQTVDRGLHKEEVIAISCPGRSVQVLKDFIGECRHEYLQQIGNKITLFKNSGDYWKRISTKEKRPLDTVIISNSLKQELVDDLKNFLSEETRHWYIQRSIPYRRGYLLHGPPGTGKSSLGSAVAGEFNLDIYIINAPNVDDQTLEELFNSLPERCVVLLEDIDAIGTDRQDSDKSVKKKKALSLSGLLNTLDGVASQEGRVLIMTTNHIKNLDEALIRPGRIDMKFEIPLADSDVTKDLFSFVFRTEKQHNAVDDETVLELSRLAADFAKKIPELEFSTAQIMSYLLKHKNSAEDALKEANDWFGLAPGEKQVTSGERKSKESLETPQHSESGLWMKRGNEEEPAEKQIKRTKQFADLKLIIPVSPPPSPCASTPPLSAVGECVVHTTSGPPDAGAGTEPDIVIQDHCSQTDCNLNAQIWDTDTYFPLDHGARKMTEDDRREVGIQGWGDEKPSSADAALASVSGSDNRSRLLEREPKCGSGVRDPTWRAGKNITVTTSIEQVVTLNTGAAEQTKFETEVKAILPSNPDNTNAVSCLPPISMTSDDNGPTSTPSKTQIGVAQPRPLPMNVDCLRTLELPEAHPLFSSDRDGLSEDNTRPTVCGPGCCNGGQLSDHQISHSLHDLVDQTKDYCGMDANHGLPLLSECVFEPNTQETPAKNKPQPETGASSSTPVKVSSFSTPSLSVVGTPVSKLCTPSSAKTDVQVELAVEAERPRDDSGAKNADEICGTDVDFDLNCGARKITEEDFVRLGLHKLSWAKLSDAITVPPPMSKPDLHGLENASKDSPFLVNGANPRDDSEENMKANKTGLDVGNSKLPVTNADSSLSMKLDPPIDFFGGMGQQTSLSKTPDVNNSDGADESVWVKVEVGTDNLATYTDM